MKDRFITETWRKVPGTAQCSDADNYEREVWANRPPIKERYQAYVLANKNYPDEIMTFEEWRQDRLDNWDL